MHWIDSRQRFSWTADPAIKSGAGGLQGTGLATSCDLAKHVIDPLLHGGSVHRGYLGVRVQPRNSGVDHQAIKSVPESRKALAKGPSEKGRLLRVRTAQGGTEYVPLEVVCLKRPSRASCSGTQGRTGIMLAPALSLFARRAAWWRPMRQSIRRAPQELTEEVQGATPIGWNLA
jgi:hypothetical protein